MKDISEIIAKSFVPVVYNSYTTAKKSTEKYDIQSKTIYRLFKMPRGYPKFISNLDRFGLIFSGLVVDLASLYAFYKSIPEMYRGEYTGGALIGLVTIGLRAFANSSLDNMKHTIQKEIDLCNKFKENTKDFYGAK